MAEGKRPDNFTIALNLFKRLSQIYGIPVRILLPIEYRIPQRELLKTGSFAAYARKFHTIDMTDLRRLLTESIQSRHLEKEEAEAKEKAVLAEELSHAAQMLLRGERFHETFGRLGRLPVEKYVPLARREAARYVQLHEKSERMTEATALKPEELVFSSDKPFEGAKKALIRKHGADALIMLYAVPAPKIAPKALLEWEKRMVRQGYLGAQGGLTRRGIAYLKEIRPRESIIARIHLAARHLAAKAQAMGPVRLREKRWLEAAVKSAVRHQRKPKQMRRA